MNNAISQIHTASPSKVGVGDGVVYGFEELEVAFLKFTIIRSMSEVESAGTSGKSLYGTEAAKGACGFWKYCWCAYTSLFSWY